MQGFIYIILIWNLSLKHVMCKGKCPVAGGGGGFQEMGMIEWGQK